MELEYQVVHWNAEMVTIPSPGRPAVTVPKAARALAIQVCGPGLRVSHCDWQAAPSQARAPEFVQVWRADHYDGHGRRPQRGRGSGRPTGGRAAAAAGGVSSKAVITKLITARPEYAP
jgi:hypothetical protein